MLIFPWSGSINLPNKLKSVVFPAPDGPTKAVVFPGNAENANIGYCHADVDLLLFNGTTLFAGTDGGIFKAEDTANVTSDYYEDLSTGLGIRQLYKIGITQTPEVIVTTGSQDNGSSFYSEAEGWKDWIGADGMEGFVDKDNSSKMFGMIQLEAQSYILEIP